MKFRIYIMTLTLIGPKEEIGVNVLLKTVTD